MKESIQNRKERVRKNTMRLAFWTFSWTATVALVTFGSLLLWDKDPVYTAIALVINVIFGIGMIRANIRNLKSMDELEQKIQLDAMGISLGVTLVGGMAYTMMDTSDLISSDAEISFLVILMALTYMVAILVGKLRYK